MFVLERLRGFDKIFVFLDFVDVDLSWLLVLFNFCFKEVIFVCKFFKLEVNFVLFFVSFLVLFVNLLVLFFNWEVFEINWLDLLVSWLEFDCNLLIFVINFWFFWFNWLELVDNFLILDINFGVFLINWLTFVVKLEDFCVKVVEFEINWFKLFVKVEFFLFSWFVFWEILLIFVVYVFIFDVIDWLVGINLLVIVFCIFVNLFDNFVKELEVIGNIWLVWFFKVERLKDWFCKFFKFFCKFWVKVIIDWVDWILLVEFWDIEVFILVCCLFVNDW